VSGLRRTDHDRFSLASSEVLLGTGGTSQAGSRTEFETSILLKLLKRMSAPAASRRPVWRRRLFEKDRDAICRQPACQGGPRLL
jgi:hypothetical protein